MSITRGVLATCFDKFEGTVTRNGPRKLDIQFFVVVVVVAIIGSCPASLMEGRSVLAEIYYPWF